MLLQRFTRGGLPTLLLCSLLAAGCAGSGPAKAPEQAATGAVPAGADASGTLAAPVIPPEALTMFEQATAIMASGDYVDAELRFKEFLLQYPDYAGAYVNLAIIYANNGDDEQTQQALDQALALDPENPAALNQMGILLRKNGNFLGAEAAYMKAVTVSPDYALAHYNLGILNELYLQRLEPALQHFEIYQSLVGDDQQVAKWIADLERRIAASQRTANVAE